MKKLARPTTALARRGFLHSLTLGTVALACLQAAPRALSQAVNQATARGRKAKSLEVLQRADSIARKVVVRVALH